MAKVLTVAELKEQAALIAKQIGEREAAEKRISELQGIIQKGKFSRMEGLAALDALFPKPAAPKRKAAGKRAATSGALPAKYFHPTDATAKPFTGKARQPGWLQGFLKKGRKLDSFTKVPDYAKAKDYKFAAMMP